ncbi:hypothetical protein [Hymenobacter antarcticus]|uniref:Uncharacterized protein n=1 Tax=Hymenobacter antarcticus TaxID=486270 RepID=A0ABP7QJ94_9BACT
MGLEFDLINLDKEELISFSGIGIGTKLRELSGMIVAGNIVNWYLLHNIGDRISFINDTDDAQVLFGGTYNISDFFSFRDVTMRIIDELVEAEILQITGSRIIDEEEDISALILKNIWDPALTGNNYF